MKTLLFVLKLSLIEFKAAPLKHIFATLFFFLGAMTGLFTGVATIAFMWFLSRPISSKTTQPHFTPFINTRQQRLLSVMQFSQHLAGKNRIVSLSIYGFGLWIFIFITAFGFNACFFGTPLYWYFCQPIFLMMMIADAYDVDIKIATKATYHLCRIAPMTIAILVLLNFSSFMGIWLSYIPLGGLERYLSLLILVTVPILLRASLAYFHQSASLLNNAIQKAYD